jgi:ribosomal protein S18 acetylase RimI-like enzyme
MMPAREGAVRTAAESDAQAAVATIVAAFIADPAARWAFPEPERYLSYCPEFVQAFGGRAFDCKTAHIVEGGAALWLPPGVGPDENALMGLIERAVPERTRSEAFAVFEQMGRYHPAEPHWYLPLIGVDPPHQGQGRGSALLRHALAGCETVAYLESSNPKNVPLYQRFGFRVVAEIQVGSSPVIYPMRRD